MPDSSSPAGVTVYAIGSPTKDQQYQYQFVNAAACRARDGSTLWLVEKTGYELYGSSLSYITKLAPAGGYGWITPRLPLVGWLNNAFKNGAIQKLVVFSHGLRGIIALRYGWGDANPNYGLTVEDVAKIDPKSFAPSPKVEFDSCNSGVPASSGGKSVAQALADRLHTAVGGWTGRTSYADINHDKSCTVRGSSLGTTFSPDWWKEKWSRYEAGGAPEYKLFNPR